MRVSMMVLAAGAMGIATPAFGQGGGGKVVDPKIGALLTEINFKYEIDKDKDYRIVFNYEKEKRSQLVYVDSDTENVDGIVIRSVFAPAADIKQNPLTLKQHGALLSEAGKLKWGNWEVLGDNLYFTIKLIEPISAKQLESAMNFVAEIADNKEIELSGKKDDF